MQIRDVQPAGYHAGIVQSIGQGGDKCVGNQGRFARAGDARYANQSSERNESIDVLQVVMFGAKYFYMFSANRASFFGNVDGKFA